MIWHQILRKNGYTRKVPLQRNLHSISRRRKNTSIIIRKKWKRNPVNGNVRKAVRIIHCKQRKTIHENYEVQYQPSPITFKQIQPFTSKFYFNKTRTEFLERRKRKLEKVMWQGWVNLNHILPNDSLLMPAHFKTSSHN